MWHWRKYALYRVPGLGILMLYRVHLIPGTYMSTVYFGPRQHCTIKFVKKVEMTSLQMDVGEYLSRIGFEPGSWPRPTLETLQSVHTRHLLSVPFENLTLHSGGLIRLDLHLFFDKIVKQRRGGFCYENNGLFSWLLTALGFQVTLLSGQVKSGFTGCYGPPQDHLILMVVVEGRRWLCDVGFGSAGFSSPLSLDTADPQERGHCMHRVREDMGMFYLEWQSDENSNEHKDWDVLYKFTFEPRSLEDFTKMCMYHQSSPSSIFFCKSFCTLLKPEGRDTYIGRRLITKTFATEATGGVVKHTRDLKDEEIQLVLAEVFGIILPSPLTPKDEEVTPPQVKY